MFVFLLVFVEINYSLGHFFYWGFIVYGNGISSPNPGGLTCTLLLTAKRNNERKGCTMSSADSTSVDSQPLSRQNPSPGNPDIRISNPSPELRRRVYEMMNEFTDSDGTCDSHTSSINENANIPKTPANATNNATNSESTNNTTSDTSGETDVAMQSIADVEGYVGNSTETVIYSTKIYETPTLEGEPSMGRNESSSDRNEQGSSGGKIPFKWVC